MSNYRRLIVAVVLAALLVGCKPTGARSVETVNSDDGEHVMVTGLGKWKFDTFLKPARRWPACEWRIDVQDKGGKRRAYSHGTENNKAFVASQPGRRAWLTSRGCGRWEAEK